MTGVPKFDFIKMFDKVRVVGTAKDLNNSLGFTRTTAWASAALRNEVRKGQIFSLKIGLKIHIKTSKFSISRQNIAKNLTVTICFLMEGFFWFSDHKVLKIFSYQFTNTKTHKYHHIDKVQTPPATKVQIYLDAEGACISTVQWSG